MSVTGHRDVRQADDNYATPEWCTKLLLPHLQRGDVLEPCCGEGAIAKVVHETWNGLGDNVDIYGFEIDEGRAARAREAGYFDHVETGDFLEDGPKLVHKWPLVITNPPFKLALEFVQLALERADTVAMLLRLAWLASAERNAFHRAHPADVIVLPKRPSFAVFVSCAAIPITTAPQCGWKQTFSPGTPAPRKCPQCGARTKSSASDSSDYGWFIWGPGRSGRIIHPEIEPAPVEESNRQFDGAAAELERLTR